MRKIVLDNTSSPELGSQVHEAFSRLARRLRTLDLPSGLTNERLSTISAILADEPVSISALAEAEIVSLPTMSRMIARLEADGFVKRREDKSDGRGVLVSTTSKGRMAYQLATQQSLTQLKSMLKTMDSEHLDAIHTLLSTLDERQLFKWEGDVNRVYAIAPIGLCYFDTDLRFRYINEWLASINGISVEAHLGKTIADVLKDFAVGVELQLRHVLQTGEPILEGEVEVETAAHPGELRRYMHNSYPDKNKDGTVVGVSCVVQDVTDRMEPEAG